MTEDIQLNLRDNIYEHLCAAFAGQATSAAYLMDDARVKGKIRQLDFGGLVRVIHFDYVIRDPFLFQSFNPADSGRVLINVNLSEEKIVKEVNDTELQVHARGESAALFYPYGVRVKHRLAKGDRGEIVLVHIDNRLVADLYGAEKMRKFASIAAYFGNRLTVHQEQLLREALGVTDKALAYSRVMEFISIFLERLERQIDELSDKRLSPEDASSIQRAVEWAGEQNLLFTIKIAELAGRANMSSTKFNEGFQVLYDASPKQFLMGAKMKMAQSLLSKNELSIAEISDRAGYADVSKFSRAFKKRFGVSPRAYR